MDVILLERIAKLGQMGDVVTVKTGYARNFLLPQGKALRANRDNMAQFEAQREELEARNAERKTAAEGVAETLNGQSFVAVRSAGETGQLYGSVAARDIAAILEENGFSIGRSQVALNQPIKIIGLHKVTIVLHPEVDAEIEMNVARSEDEAERQAAGEDLTRRDAFDDEDEGEEEEDINIEDVFDNPEDVDLDTLDDADVAGAAEATAEAEEEAGV